EAGIDNVSVDLIFGLPDRLGRDWGADLEGALRLEPEHVSLYGLTAEPGAPLGRWVAEGRERLPDEDEYGAQYLLAAERLTAAGFRHYEVSNFALPGRESRHNQVYWSGAAYLGLGPGAHSYLAGRRWWNVRSWAAYAAALGRGEAPVEGAETVEGDAARLERTWLALRTSDGFPLRAASEGQRRLAARWVEQGWAVVAGDVLRLTPGGWLLLDRLAVELDTAAGSLARIPRRGDIFPVVGWAWSTDWQDDERRRAHGTRATGARGGHPHVRGNCGAGGEPRRLEEACAGRVSGDGPEHDGGPGGDGLPLPPAHLGGPRAHGPRVPLLRRHADAAGATDGRGAAPAEAGAG